tara:strand:+ start:64 stop:519 length:456 start_codon:yes stop_codon:yes gene_type:complete
MENLSDDELSEEPNLYLSNDVDQMTMELLMNKNSKHKYKSKTNPENKLMYIDHNNELLKYKTQILEITEQKINDSHTQINGDLDTIFDAYVLACIRHFKQKEIERSNLFNEEPMDNKITQPKLKKTKDPFSLWTDQKVYRRDYYDKSDDEI